MITEYDMIPYNELYIHVNHINNYSNNIEYIIEEEANNPDKNMKSAMDDFKTSKDKSPEKLKKVISNAYNKTPDQIIDNTPKIFDFTRFFVVMGGFALNPILGIITFFTDQFLKRHYRRPEAEKMINKYQKEIDKVDKKIDKTTNENKLKKLEEYKKTLEENMEKLKEYENDLYTDEENEKREDERYEANNKDDYDDDFNFDEAVSIISMINTVNNADRSKIENIIENNIKAFIDNECLDDITDFVINSDGFISKSKLMHIYENALDEYRGHKDIYKYIYIDTIKSNIQKLKEYTDTSDIDDLNRIVGCYYFIEAFNALDSELSSPYFLEVSFNNTFNIVKNKVKDAFNTMTDKEKQISNTIDNTIDSFKNNAEGYFSSNSREKILRGNILPSASKILKMALGAGLAGWLIHPVVAVIGVLGYLGVSSISQSKERKLIIDEIDTELEMVDKYIEQAERKDDLKAMKNLLTTKKKLQRERTRIKYKMEQKGEALDSETIDKLK